MPVRSTPALTSSMNNLKSVEFWKHAYESLDEEEYEKLANDIIAKKQNDFYKFNESFEQESDFWKNASVSLDQSDFEKLVEEQCLEEPFCDDVQMDIDFEPYLNLFKKGDKFWNLATKNLKDEEYEKLVQIYIASDVHLPSHEDVCETFRL